MLSVGAGRRRPKRLKYSLSHSPDPVERSLSISATFSRLFDATIGTEAVVVTLRYLECEFELDGAQPITDLIPFQSRLNAESLLAHSNVIDTHGRREVGRDKLKFLCETMSRLTLQPECAEKKQPTSPAVSLSSVNKDENDSEGGRGEVEEAGKEKGKLSPSQLIEGSMAHTPMNNLPKGSREDTMDAEPMVLSDGEPGAEKQQHTSSAVSLSSVNKDENDSEGGRGEAVDAGEEKGKFRKEASVKNGWVSAGSVLGGAGIGSDGDSSSDDGILLSDLGNNWKPPKKTSTTKGNQV